MRRSIAIPIRTASRLTGVCPREILSKRRTDRIVKARDTAIWMARFLGQSSTAIGQAFGMDHSSVLSAAKRHEAPK